MHYSKNIYLQNSLKRKFIIFLFLYHLFFGGVAFYILTKDPADAQNYWFVGDDLSKKNWLDFLNPGTDVVKWFTYPLVKYLNLPFWSGFFIFSVISFSGIVVLYHVMIKITSQNYLLKLFTILLLLLPNLHFWSSNIGKESLLLLPIVIIIYKIFEERYFSFMLIASLFFISIIRPHVGFILMISYVLSLLITLKLSNQFKIILISGFIFFTAAFTMILIQIQDFSGGIQRVLTKYEVHIEYFKRTEAYVPLDQYILPYKIFTFYFRPLPFEKQGLLYLVASAENTVLLLFSCIASYYCIKYFSILRKKILFVFPVILFLLFSIMYVYAYANFGIILRTKIIVIPFFYIFILVVMATRFNK